MRPTLLILLFCCTRICAQVAPPVIQWQKCFGGSSTDGARDIQATADGGFILAGGANSGDGDVAVNYGISDVWIIKTDAAGSIQWKKVFGGTGLDYAVAIQPTGEGGYIFIGATTSVNGDITGNHGSQDIWVVKLDGAGNLQWQKCLGGSGGEGPGSICPTSDGGYIIAGNSFSDDGDVSGHHGNSTEADCWVAKLDGAGNLQWQKSLGGTRPEGPGLVIQAADGGYILVTLSESNDGDVTGNHGRSDFWVVRLDGTGSLQWQRCYGGSSAESYVSGPVQAGNGFAVTGISTSTDGDVTRNRGASDCWVIKVDAAGNLLWQHSYGGTSDDLPEDIRTTADGGYIVAARSKSSDGDACSNYGSDDFWILKLDNGGNLEWQKSYGGTLPEFPGGVLQTADGGYIVAGQSASNDTEVSGNHGAFDVWLVKLSFPGIPVIAGVSISSDRTVICPGRFVTFTATPVNGGSAPSYEWQVNGTTIPETGTALTINTLGDGDVVTCTLTSNLPCITVPVARSNAIAISVNPSLVPSGFLPADITKCSYDVVELVSLQNYTTYLWSTNAATPAIMAEEPGAYWLEVTDANSCTGRETILVNNRNCIEGVHIPSAFTPNNDGKNDLFRPLIFGNLLQYRFTIYNRWGQIIFQTSNPAKGWDGSSFGTRLTSTVYIWTCTYQLQGELLRFEKGTVTAIR